VNCEYWDTTSDTTATRRGAPRVRAAASRKSRTPGLCYAAP